MVAYNTSWETKVKRAKKETMTSSVTVADLDAVPKVCCLSALRS